MNDDIVFGTPPDAGTTQLEAAAQHLTLDKSLDRVVASAKFVISTIALVAAVLTGLGFLTASTISQNSTARAFAIATLVLAPTALTLSLVPLILRQQKINLSNLKAVEDFYEEQFKRARLVSWAGVLLVAAIVSAALAAIIAATAGPSARTSSSLTIVLDAGVPSVTAQIVGSHLASGHVINFQVITREQPGSTGTVVARGRLQANDAGAASMTTAIKLPTAMTEAALVVNGTETARVDLR